MKHIIILYIIKGIAWTNLFSISPRVIYCKAIDLVILYSESVELQEHFCWRLDSMGAFAPIDGVE